MIASTKAIPLVLIRKEIFFFFLKVFSFIENYCLNISKLDEVAKVDYNLIIVNIKRYNDVHINS
jgi:hypothetical protein